MRARAQGRSRAILCRPGAAASAALFLGSVALLGGCSNDGATLFTDTVLGDAPVSLSRDIQPIFNARCAVPGCHGSGAQSAGMSLEASDIYAPVIGIVGVPSTGASGLNRVAPGNAESSYLVHKIQGTQLSVGGEGDRMPLGEDPLPDSDIMAIRKWIDQGALPN